MDLTQLINIFFFLHSKEANRLSLEFRYSAILYQEFKNTFLKAGVDSKYNTGGMQPRNNQLNRIGNGIDLI